MSTVADTSGTAHACRAAGGRRGLTGSFHAGPGRRPWTSCDCPHGQGDGAGRCRRWPWPLRCAAPGMCFSVSLFSYVRFLHGEGMWWRDHVALRLSACRCGMVRGTPAFPGREASQARGVGLSSCAARAACPHDAGRRRESVTFPGGSRSVLPGNPGAKERPRCRKTANALCDKYN